MGAKKFQNLFKKYTNEVSAKTETSSTNPGINMGAKKQESTKPNTRNIRDKAEVEQLQKLIINKLKQPENAKKAAQIISDMINKK